MVLAPDQRAILELLLSQKRSYEQIGETTGLDPEEVRRRSRAALAAISGQELDPELADLLLGRLDADRRESARRTLRRDAERSAIATEVAASIRRELGVDPAFEPAASGARRSEPGAPSVRLVAVSFGLAALALVIALVGLPWGGEEDASPVAEERLEAEPIEVALRSPDGGEGAGRAIVHVGDELDPLLDLELEGLHRPAEGELHLLWVERGDGRGVPLATELAIDADGGVAQRFALAPELLAIIEASRSLAVLSVDRGALRDLSRQLDEGPEQEPAGEAPLPERRGEVLLTGRLPRT